MHCSEIDIIISATETHFNVRHECEIPQHVLKTSSGTLLFNTMMGCFGKLIRI